MLRGLQGAGDGDESRGRKSQVVEVIPPSPGRKTCGKRGGAGAQTNGGAGRQPWPDEAGIRFKRHYEDMLHQLGLTMVLRLLQGGAFLLCWVFGWHMLMGFAAGLALGSAFDVFAKRKLEEWD